ncbi:MAG: PASTA domain-containing protein, partial [Propionibacteriaceae bacterium]|nr:PASTA domain-containing protein [Propionibacteriaceae bacterium]
PTDDFGSASLSHQLLTAGSVDEDVDEQNRSTMSTTSKALIALLAVVVLIAGGALMYILLTHRATPTDPSTMAPSTGAPSMPTSRDTVEVPSVEGLDQAEATLVLTTLGFTVKVETAASADVAQGAVISTDPAKGGKADRGAVITMIVSSGIACPEGVTLPDGVDKNLVCGPAPVSTAVLPSFTFATGSGMPTTAAYGFASPTRNLACSWYEDGYTVICDAVVLETTMPTDPKNPSSGNCRHGLYVDDSRSGVGCNSGVLGVDLIPTTQSAPTLEYGQIVLSSDYPNTAARGQHPDPVACLSDEDGITCWNTVTAHGVKINRVKALFW